VMADIRHMLNELKKDPLNFQGIYRDSMNREQVEFCLDRELTETLVTGYSIPLRHKVIQRLHELESKQAPALPNFSNPADAARAWADQYEQRAAAEQALAIAAPKAAFVDQYVTATGSMGF